MTQPLPQPVVAFDRLKKQFRVGGSPLTVIDDLSLAIYPGELVAIVGSSGCGKSTLLRLLVGLDNNYQGRILVDGAPINGIGGERGIVFQEPRLFPWLTVRQNIELGLASEKIGRATLPAGSTISFGWCIWTSSPTPSPPSCPAAWRNGWRSPAGWWATHVF